MLPLAPRLSLYSSLLLSHFQPSNLRPYLFMDYSRFGSVTLSPAYLSALAVVYIPSISYPCTSASSHLIYLTTLFPLSTLEWPLAQSSKPAFARSLTRLTPWTFDPQFDLLKSTLNLWTLNPWLYGRLTYSLELESSNHNTNRCYDRFKPLSFSHLLSSHSCHSPCFYSPRPVICNMLLSFPCLSLLHPSIASLASLTS